MIKKAQKKITQENSLIVSLENNHLIILIIIIIRQCARKNVQSENFFNKLWQTAKKEYCFATKSLCQSI